MWFAQRGEDQRLAQLLDGQRVGFYIDVGAWEPVLDSVTNYFYGQGWSGINIEPIPYYHEKLNEARPRDLNLRVAVGDKIEARMFTHIHHTGLSTFVDEYRDQFLPGRGSDTFQVSVLTLDEIARQFVNQPIDFLKIDVEGWERQVLLGASELFRTNPPRFMVIEATVPGTDTPAWDTWDQLVLDYGYEFIEFDGLNRWYRWPVSA